MSRTAGGLRARTIGALREFLGRSGASYSAAIVRDLVFNTALGQWLATGFAGARGRSLSREFAVALPAGYPAREIRLRLDIPELPFRSLLAFSEHVMDAAGAPTETVLATTRGGFAVSRDLGTNWSLVPIRTGQYARHQLLRIKSIGHAEFLAQAQSRHWHAGAEREIHNLVLNENGDVLAANSMIGAPWHSCRSVDIANGTLMYAEYPYDPPGGQPSDRAPSRVFRSRDNGRSWEIVLECSGALVRHFHVLQARPGTPGEWWLTSGDKRMESNVWVSTDDGDTWECLTKSFGDPVAIDGLSYPRTMFRMTDLLWEGDTVVWGTDDYLPDRRLNAPGARIFRSPARAMEPRCAARLKWPIRNLVDVGAFYLILTQGSVAKTATAEEKRPGVYLMPKAPVEGAPDAIHLFDADVFSAASTGFTYSRASRAARNGTFFSYRASTDLFPFGHNILRWDVAFA